MIGTSPTKIDRERSKHASDRPLGCWQWDWLNYELSSDISERPRRTANNGMADTPSASRAPRSIAATPNRP